jgi:hypothetical protein
MTAGNDCSTRNDLAQFRSVRMRRHSYDAYMSFSFLSSEFGICLAKLRATGRYGFSLPKQVEITAPSGQTCIYHYYNRKPGLKSELTNQAIVRIAIARFLAGAAHGCDAAVEIDETTAPFSGVLTQVRACAPPVSMRVRPGPTYARSSTSDQPAAVPSEQTAAGP